MKPHKHAELIKAWADGAEIEIRHFVKGWTPMIKEGEWFEHYEYRIKPEPKPDVIGNVYVNWFGTLEWIMGQMTPNLKLIFDGETGDLKSAEVLK